MGMLMRRRDEEPTVEPVKEVTKTEKQAKEPVKNDKPEKKTRKK